MYSYKKKKNQPTLTFLSVSNNFSYFTLAGEVDGEVNSRLLHIFTNPELSLHITFLPLNFDVSNLPLSGPHPTQLIPFSYRGIYVTVRSHERK